MCDSLKHADVSAAETFMRSPLSVKMTFNVPSVSGLKCSPVEYVYPKPLKSASGVFLLGNLKEGKT